MCSAALKLVDLIAFIRVANNACRKPMPTARIGYTVSKYLSHIRGISRPTSYNCITLYRLIIVEVLSGKGDRLAYIKLRAPTMILILEFGTR